MANYYDIVFSNIENAYKNHKKLLLENDMYRPCKSITRDIFSSMDKFRTYYKSKGKVDLKINDILECLDNATEVNDTVNTNIRVMRELKLLVIDGDDYHFTKNFINLANSTTSSPKYFLEKLKNCKKLSDFCMIYNTVICTLREGYLTSRIISFSESYEGFVSDVPDKAKRIDYCKKVYEIYGFRGRNKSVDSDSYTPNPNYRILTVLKNSSLNLVTMGTKVDNMNTYILTKEAFELLTIINRNFEDMFLNISNTKSDAELNALRVKGGRNIILYGVPGAGKSYTIETEYCKDEDKMERLVFHPDYTYSDFVGQILPSIDESGETKPIKYKFEPGPFTTLLKKAYRDPENRYYLIIEEINRGNAPAIFGDIFQLLDRTVDGTSMYGITNADIAKIVYDDPNHKVRIPSNMSILCTMNTSDQNVFTLDTAFQRRWNMRLIENAFKENDELANIKILDSSVTWRVFQETINEIILNTNVRLTSAEDKRLGTHFVVEEDLKYNDKADTGTGQEQIDAKLENRRFAEKVIKYLWDDAFKFNRESLFNVRDNGTNNSLEAIIRSFLGAKGDARFDIFLDNIKRTMIDESKPKDEAPGDADGTSETN